jgi:hypothetical protein
VIVDGNVKSPRVSNIDHQAVTYSLLQKEFQHEGEHDGKDDWAWQVERRKDAQCESGTKKECPRIGWQWHFRPGIRHRGMRLRRAIVQDGRRGGTLRSGEAATKGSPPEREKSRFDDGLAEREGIRH